MPESSLPPTPPRSGPSSGLRPQGAVILVTGPAGPAHDALHRSLLAAPGTWDASEVRPLTPAALAEHHARLHPGQRDLTVTPRPVVLDTDGSRCAQAPAALGEQLVVVHLHEDPTRPARTSRDPAIELGTWREVSRAALDLVEQLGPGRSHVVDVDDVLAEPEDATQRACAAVGLGWHVQVSVPWRDLRFALAADRVANEVAPGQQTTLLAARAAGLAHPTAPSIAPTSAPGSLTAHDDGLAQLLDAIGSSLVVTTYQSGRVILLRHDAGRLGVHLRAFDRPMGIALHPTGFALGVATEVLDYRNVAELAATVEPKGSHDAYFLPRNSHVTGDIAVHDLAFGSEGLWVVATEFSCLATLDTDHSFVPRWHPPFISAVRPGDRCHLNGVALVDGAPRYVTALGVSDEPRGWRARKGDGGVLLEVPSGRTVVEGLSMPHSPRWHAGRLWVLESGRGRLLVCDPATGATTTVAEVPGFARGLSFHGYLAFVATSQVRETATFGDLPVQEMARRECGVWAIDTRTGSVVASVRFEDRIREIFDVAVLPGVRFPDVAEAGSEHVRSAWVLPSSARPANR